MAHAAATAQPYLLLVAAHERRSSPQETAMKTFTSLAAAIAVTLAAGAASAQDVRIPWGDLDMSSAAGADVFDARVSAAARQMCRGVKRPGSRITDRAFCHATVRSEAVRQLPGAVQVDYALSRLPIVT